MSSKWNNRTLEWNERGNMKRVERSPNGAFTTKPGVYAVYADGRLMYIGMADRMATRVSQHFITGWMAEHCEKVLERQVREFAVKYRAERFLGERATLEMRLIARLKPPVNRLGTGVRINRRPKTSYREAAALWRGDLVAWWTPQVGRNLPSASIVHRYRGQGQTFCSLDVPGEDRRVKPNTKRERCQRCATMFARAETYREQAERDAERSA